MTSHIFTQLLQQRLAFTEQAQEAPAAVLIAITDEAEPRVVLTRRSIYLSNHAGEVAFPGGKRDPEDSSNSAVALREAQEEIDLNPFDVQLIGDLPMQQARSGMWVKPIVGLIPPNLQLTAQPTEIERIFYVSLQELMDAPLTPHQVLYQNQTLYFPSLHVENEIVWGLTARMLVSLFDYGLDYKKDWPFLLSVPREFDHKEM